jgi:hypothetical protein
VGVSGDCVVWNSRTVTLRDIVAVCRGVPLGQEMPCGAQPRDWPVNFGERLTRNISMSQPPASARLTCLGFRTEAL